ncbi:MAG: hypothetical protein IJP64_06675 [Oscillospiraceae bacterium]|nr:hypothetical protein [Oscillospiraceae bacterium]
MEETSAKRTGRLLPWIAAAALLVCAAAAVLVFTVRIGGHFYRRAAVIDARDAVLTVEEYEAASQKYPDRSIRWSVPIGDERFDSFAETITLAALPADEIDRFRYFPNLKTVDARGCADLAALAALASERTELDVAWTVPSADGPIDGNAETLTATRCGADELQTLLGLLPRLRRVDLRESALSDAEVDALRAAHPSLRFVYTVRLWGKDYPSDCAALTLASAEGSAEELCAALRRFTALEELDIRGADFSCAELTEILALCPEGARYTVPLCGTRYDDDTEEIDLSGVPVDDLAAVEEAVALLPGLKKLVMCDCGPSDEEMDALNREFEDLRVVWTVHFSVYSLRTDATVFCASDLPSHGYIAPAASSEELAPLRYCTDLVALDLGHMFFKDLSFLEGLTQLKYLILVEERFHDISVLGTLGELEYLEIFNNTIDDISPLLNCKKLRHLNVGYTRGYDPAPLWEMTWLERLWYPGNRMGKENCASLAAALPDTLCFLPSWDIDGSTGGGWRTAPVYYEMRNLFGMFYQPGGTGVEKDA